MNNDLISSEKKLTVLRNLSILSSLLLFGLIVYGGVVRATASFGSCLGWPACSGTWLLPGLSGLFSPISVDVHRLISVVAGFSILAGTIIAWRNTRQRRWIIIPYAVSSILYIIQIGVGPLMSQVTLIKDVRSSLSTVHMLLSLVILALLLVPTVLLFIPDINQNSSIHWQLRKSSSIGAVLVGSLLFVLFTSGAVLSRFELVNACRSWPLCNVNLIELDWVGWVNLFHRGLVVLVGLLLTWLMVNSWQSRRSQTLALVASTTSFVLFFAQALLGARLVIEHPLYLQALHQATAVATWVAITLLVIATGLLDPNAPDRRMELVQRRIGLFRDLLMLTKPIVVALLLVTTFAGMVIGARAWSSAWTMFWTLLGGFMAAGGSGAINQYIDRLDDSKMQRTQRRPIPAGRLTPGEGLAFGAGMTLASFYIMVAFVNLIAALLTLAGIIYYVLIYSIFLKKTTVQNIVIGGGAGAIPPLVGWAAATGSLNIPSLFLFAVVFMWTPPHFWALALVRRTDYARAGVPMLPVVRGESETRKQVLFYTIELVILTLVLPIFGLGGSLYLIGAGLLGLWLLSTAWRVWRKGGNKSAWKMYRYSSMYLAFLFILLMIDRLL